MSQKVMDEKYSRLELIYGPTLKVVRDAKILVAGVGAIGNNVAAILAQMGFGHIFLVDKDELERSNLTRSVLYTNTDIGRPKVDAAADGIARINSDCAVIPWHGDIADLGLGVIRRADVVLSALDSFLPRIILGNGCRQLGKPFITSGIAGDRHWYGQIVNYSSTGACPACSIPADFLRSEKERSGVNGFSCAGLAKKGLEQGVVASTPIMASLMAALQVQEAVKILTGGDDFKPNWDRLVGIDSMALTSHSLELGAFSTCPEHNAIQCIPADSLLETELNSANSIGELLQRARSEMGRGRAFIELRQTYLLSAVCPDCGRTTPVMKSALAFADLARRDKLACPNCKGSNLTPGREVTRLDDELEAAYRNMTLEQFGLPALEIYKVIDDDRAFFLEMSGDEEKIGMG